MKEQKIQQEFFDIVTQKKEAPRKALVLYQELVHHRFYEVISNANPIFNSLMKKKKLKKLITKFIQSGAKTDLIWQLPKEFKAFVKKEKKLLKKMPFLNDLLWFEYIEIKLFMRDYSTFKKSPFQWNKKYQLSNGACIKKLDYRVYLKAFEQKEKNCVLVYYDIELQEVVFREISSFMYEYLKLLKQNSLKKSLKHICKKYGLQTKEVQTLLETPLKELCDLGVLSIKG